MVNSTQNNNFSYILIKNMIMKKYKPSTINKTIFLIVLSHLLFLALVGLLYFRIIHQEKGLIQHPLLFDSKNSVFERELTMSFSTIKNALLLLSVLIVLSLISYVVFAKRYLFHPIYLITSALETGSKKCIKLLKRWKIF